jgi:CDP-diacylglycerol--serine O-phosphatidyltransferase
MLAGYAAILMATQGRFYVSCGLILIAAVLDGLDGRVARLTRTTSEFGGQLDSLADAISFAVAPSMLAFSIGIAALDRLGWAVCFLFASCGVIRLARFNAAPSRSPKFFIGLPIPAAAATIVSPTLLLGNRPVPEPWVPAYAVLVGLIGLLMVSRVRFRTFKDLRFGPKPYRVLALFALILAGLIAAHEWVVPALLAAYLLLPAAEKLRRRGPAAALDRAEDAEPEVSVDEEWNDEEDARDSL